MTETGSGDRMAMEEKVTRFDKVLWLLGLCTRDGLEGGGKEKGWIVTVELDTPALYVLVSHSKGTDYFPCGICALLGLVCLVSLVSL